MTLLELPHNMQATVLSVKVANQYEEKLHAVGICVGSTITKIHDTTARPEQPVCVMTHERSIFAISRTLAAHITLGLTQKA